MDGFSCMRNATKTQLNLNQNNKKMVEIKVVDIEFILSMNSKAGNCIEIASPIDSVFIWSKRLTMSSSLQSHCL